MAYSVSGRIKRKSVKDARVSLNVNGELYSAFVIGKGVSPDFQEAMRGLMEGDSVDLQVEDNQGKDGNIYHNIKGAVKVVQIRDEDEVPPVQSTGQPHKSGTKETPEIGKIVGTCTQYAVLYANQKMATTGEVVSVDEIKEVACALARFQDELIRTWGE